MGCGLFLEEKSLVRAFIRGKPDDECNGNLSPINQMAAETLG
jgi:hypothetical protein